MTDHITGQGTSTQTRGEGFSLGTWIWANVAGLGLAYGLFALLGDLAEFGLDVGHDSLVRNIALLIAVATGATVFVVLRRKALAAAIPGSAGVAVGAGVALAIGLIIGFAVGGPPFDFILGVIALGTIGGALQWRALRHTVKRPGGLLIASIGGWVLAGIVAGLFVVLAGDFLHQLLGAPQDGTVAGTLFFTLILTLVGVVGGGVGGVIEGRALQRRLG